MVPSGIRQLGTGNPVAVEVGPAPVHLLRHAPVAVQVGPVQMLRYAPIGRWERHLTRPRQSKTKQSVKKLIMIDEKIYL